MLCQGQRPSIRENLAILEQLPEGQLQKILDPKNAKMADHYFGYKQHIVSRVVEAGQLAVTDGLHTPSAAVAQSEAFTADASASKLALTSLASAGVPSVNVLGIVTWACAELAALSRRAGSSIEVRSMSGSPLERG